MNQEDHQFRWNFGKMKNLNVNTCDEEFIKVYKYRWVILFLYSLYSAINFFQFPEFGIISDIVEEYYQTSTTEVNLTGVLFMAIFILLFAPIGYLTKKTNLYVISLFTIGLTTFGNILKLFALEPGDFYLILIAQTSIAIGAIAVMIIPTKIANTWFGPEEVSTACAIAVFGSQAGAALGCMVPALVVKHNDDMNITRESFKTLYVYNAVFSVVTAILVAVFFRSKPLHPPSPSQLALQESKMKKENNVSYWKALKLFCRNRDFLIVLFSYGIAYGMWNVFGVLINEIYLNYFPDDQNGEIGILIGIAFVIGGCLGSVFFGYLLDKTHEFKKISIFALSANALSITIQFTLLMMKNKWGSHLMIPITGFFQASMMVIAFEYSSETTYPIPEEFSAAICNVAIFIFAIFHIVVLRILYDYVSYSSGNLLIIFSSFLAAISFFFVSPELKRRNANLKRSENTNSI